MLRCPNCRSKIDTVFDPAHGYLYLCRECGFTAVTSDLILDKDDDSKNLSAPIVGAFGG